MQMQMQSGLTRAFSMGQKKKKKKELKTKDKVVLHTRIMKGTKLERNT